MKRTGDLKLIKELNKSIILDIIRKQGPISRAEIAKKVKISPTTVTSAVSELINESLVIEGGMGTSSGGRKPILVQLNPQTCFIIGIAIDASKVTIAKLNLHAEVLDKEVTILDHTENINVSELIIRFMEDFFSKLSSLENCLGISITTQGIVDSVNGVILYNPKLHIKDLPLKNIIEETFQIPTYIDNDTNGNLLAEIGFGKHLSAKNIIYITMGDGVGASIFVNGSIFRGFNGGAGEFGHTTINHAGPLCECGNVGCLENYVGWRSVKSKIIRAIKRGETTLIAELISGDDTKITPDVFAHAVQAEDHLSVSMMHEIITYFGSGLVNLVNLFNPEKIIIGGEFAYKNPLIINQVKEYINGHAMETHTRDLEVHPTSFGSDFEVIGSASLLLHELFHFTLS